MSDIIFLFFFAIFKYKGKYFCSLSFAYNFIYGNHEENIYVGQEGAVHRGHNFHAKRQHRHLRSSDYILGNIYPSGTLNR